MKSNGKMNSMYCFINTYQINFDIQWIGIRYVLSIKFIFTMPY